ncbi:Predicted methyltransferase regulatory domain-containing protein [Moraxella cuniculi DSM 21768]|uniref:Predicted methyltransferase regulatory domain-containing protein n=1 Tax=Moraxella cuniculi DSM 21768 TaxID=1122245 RepID=A0A1N7FK19_9GAMM|nr:class I SAM-dependent methyltransferase [Moraxella cuniculi]OOS02225.1 hypothetical protein B0189_10155 [Moraxella cuniculi]SIS00624.1 Predicted methyltransferase regulatory domain-containing protein [Moraxella cuniculi DSM 21768]
MTSWSEGYVSDINYTYGYYSELNPQNLTVPFLMAGIAPPKIRHACELGFGQGLSINIHSAGSDINWHGTDFNPDQALFAQHLSAQANTTHKTQLYDQSFAQFCSREDLPEFDYIGLHGIWSWISDDNRRIIVDFIRRKLRVGGVLYISYNTLPGWSGLSPLRHLFVEHDLKNSSNANTRQINTQQAINQTQAVLQLSDRLIRQTPELLNRANDLTSKNMNYLAHEYLNRDWQPMYYSQVEDWLADAKMSYACSAYYLDDYDDCLFNHEQKEYLNSINNKSLKQTTKDYLLNRQFRRDYWVKGSYQLNSAEYLQAWEELSVILIKNPDELNASITHYRNITIMDELFLPLVDIVKDGKIHSVKKLIEQLAGKLSKQQVISLLALLIGKNDIALAQDKEQIKASLPHCQKLNLHLVNRAKTSGEIYHLASPVTTSGIGLTRIEQLFVLAHYNKVAKDGWADFVWQILKADNQTLIKDNQPLSGNEDNLAELQSLAEKFIKTQMPILKRLQIID